MSNSTFRTSRRVEFAETDMAGMMHFSNFFRFMEAAEVDFLHAHGLSVALSWEGDTIGFPRRAASCEYFLPARFGDILQITVRVARLGCKSVTYAFDFYRGNELIASGQVACVCCRVLEKRGIEPIEIPGGLRKLFEAACK